MSHVLAAPYAASTPTVLRFELVPSPQTLSLSVNRVKLRGLVELFASKVMCLPRAGSVSRNFEGPRTVWIGTLPL